jgi:hypothetical protein
VLTQNENARFAKVEMSGYQRTMFALDVAMRLVGSLADMKTRSVTAPNPYPEPLRFILGVILGVSRMLSERVSTGNRTLSLWFL